MIYNDPSKKMWKINSYVCVLGFEKSQNNLTHDRWWRDGFFFDAVTTWCGRSTIIWQIFPWGGGSFVLALGRYVNKRLLLSINGRNDNLELDCSRKNVVRGRIHYWGLQDVSQSLPFQTLKEEGKLIQHSFSYINLLKNNHNNMTCKTTAKDISEN